MLFSFDIFDPRAKDLVTECQQALVGLQLEGVAEVRVLDAAQPMAMGSLDAFLTVTNSERTLRFVCEAKRRIGREIIPGIVTKLQMNADRFKARPLLLAGYVNPNDGKRLREAGISYIDTAGNVSLVFPPVYILTQGFKATDSLSSPASSGSAHAQVIALLLAKPEAINWPYREIAFAAGVSLGTVSHTVKALRHAGHVRLASADHCTVTRRTALFERWMLDYRRTIRPRMKPMRYRWLGELSADEIYSRLPAELHRETMIGGEVAAATVVTHLRPQRAALHVNPHFPILQYVKSLRLLPDREGNIDILQQFGDLNVWRYEPKPLLAHPILVQAEVASGDTDTRLLETVRLLYEEILTPILANESIP